MTKIEGLYFETTIARNKMTKTTPKINPIEKSIEKPAEEAAPATA
jgi:Tfp pilus assembly major pilin PilA